MLGAVANIQMTTTANNVGQNLNFISLRLVPAYRARTYTVTAYVAMNRSLPAAADPIIVYISLQRKIDGEGLNTSGRIKSYMNKVNSAMITTSEDATMLPRINLTVAGIVFSVMMAIRSRMLTVKTGMRKNRIYSNEK